MEEEQKNTGSENETVSNSGTEIVTETKQTLDEILAGNKELQSQYDKKVTSSLQTAKIKWEEEQKRKTAEAKAEAEKLAKMDSDEKKTYELEQWKARAEKAEKQNSINELKSETIKQATEKGISLEYISTLNFEYETAETIKIKLETLEKAVKKEREKAISEYSKEPTPKTGDDVKKEDNLSSYEKFLQKYEKERK